MFTCWHLVVVCPPPIKIYGYTPAGCYQMSDYVQQSYAAKQNFYYRNLKWTFVAMILSRNKDQY